jgi:hypothetical protein
MPTAIAEGVDYSHSRPNLDCLRRVVDKRFVVRYVGTPSSGKNLTVDEAAAIRLVGLDLAAVYETTAGYMLGGRERGRSAAIAAVTDARRYGYPAGRPIYYALDVDPRGFTGTEWSAVREFLNGARDVTGREAVGVYGAFEAIERLCPDWAPFGWQTYAWSRGFVSEKAALYQYRNGQDVCGGTVDLCRSFRSDFGQWSLETEDDLTPDQSKKLDEIHAAFRNSSSPLSGNLAGRLDVIFKAYDQQAQWDVWSGNLPGRMDYVYALLRDPTSLAEALAAELPDNVTQAAVEAALKAVLGSLDAEATP